jgi:hypothetical protein
LFFFWFGCGVWGFLFWFCLFITVIRNQLVIFILFVVLVVVDEPQGAHAYGSTVAVPVAKQIIDALLIVEKISPSKPAELNKAMTS